MSEAFNSKDMPILEVDLNATKRFSAARFLDSPETIAAFLTEAMKANDGRILRKAFAEAVKARCLNLTV